MRYDSVPPAMCTPTNTQGWYARIPPLPHGFGHAGG
jgi:hypothetical protein